MSLGIAEAATFTFGCAIIHRYRTQPAVVTAVLLVILAALLLAVSILWNWQTVGRFCGSDASTRFSTEFCTGLVSV